MAMAATVTVVECSGGEAVLVPTVDLLAHDAPAAVAEACRRLGCFRATNHGVPAALAEALEVGAMDFFALPEQDKESSLIYGSRSIGCNGDSGWLEYLMVTVASSAVAVSALPTPLRVAFEEYTGAVREVSDRVLDMMVEGLGVDEEHRPVLRKMVSLEQKGGNDEILRVNHYPSGRPLDVSDTGFGEHTDPQIMSLLRSTRTAGFQIKPHGSTHWLPVAPDPDSLFINVGDSLQVLTNGRFRSVMHRVIAPEGILSRLSLIYFVGPSESQRIVPLRGLMPTGEHSLYREFTWGEYKAAAGKTRLGDCRLTAFEAPSAHNN